MRVSIVFLLSLSQASMAAHPGDYYGRIHCGGAKCGVGDPHTHPPELHSHLTAERLPHLCLGPENPQGEAAPWHPEPEIGTMHHANGRTRFKGRLTGSAHSWALAIIDLLLSLACS